MPHALKGKAVALRVADGYGNATAMCQAAGKLYADFARLGSTAEFLSELGSAMGIPISLLTYSRASGPYAARGIWMHPLAACALAMWCLPKFHVQVTVWLGVARRPAGSSALPGHPRTGHAPRGAGGGDRPPPFQPPPAEPAHQERSGGG